MFDKNTVHNLSYSISSTEQIHLIGTHLIYLALPMQDRLAQGIQWYRTEFPLVELGNASHF